MPVQIRLGSKLSESLPRIPVVCALLFALMMAVPVRASADDKAKTEDKAEAKTEEKKDEKKDEEKKDDEKKRASGLAAAVDPNYASQLALTLSSAVGALISIQTIPASVKASLQAVDEMKNFTKNNKDYVRLQEELETFLAQKESKLAELKLAIDRYQPALSELDTHVRSVLGEQPSQLAERYGTVEQDLVRLSEMPKASRFKAEIDAALEGWRLDHRSYPIESWIGKHMSSAFLKSPEGRGWLLEYTRHQKELAAAFWLEKGSALLLDEWLERNKGRKMVFGKNEQSWQVTLAGLKVDEEKAAKVFVREFSIFARDLNSDIHNPTLSELLTWANREPGVFHSSDNGRPTPVAAASLESYSRTRCDAGMQALSGAVALARQKGSYLTLPWQGLKAVAPVASAGATIATGYISVRGLIRLTTEGLPGDKAADKKAAAKDEKPIAKQ